MPEADLRIRNTPDGEKELVFLEYLYPSYLGRQRKLGSIEILIMMMMMKINQGEGGAVGTLNGFRTSYLLIIFTRNPAQLHILSWVFV